jgi:hypothetical protein
VGRRRSLKFAAFSKEEPRTPKTGGPRCLLVSLEAATAQPVPAPLGIRTEKSASRQMRAAHLAYTAPPVRIAIPGLPEVPHAEVCGGVAFERTDLAVGYGSLCIPEGAGMRAFGGAGAYYLVGSGLPSKTKSQHDYYVRGKRAGSKSTGRAICHHSPSTGQDGVTQNLSSRTKLATSSGTENRCREIPSNWRFHRVCFLNFLRHPAKTAWADFQVVMEKPQTGEKAR